MPTEDVFVSPAVPAVSPVEKARLGVIRLSHELKGDEAAYTALSAWIQSSQFLTTLQRAIEQNEPVELYSVLPKRAAEFGAIEELQNSLGLGRQSLVEMHPWIVTVTFQEDGTPSVNTAPLNEE